MIIYPPGNNLNPLNQNFVNLIVNFCWLYTDGDGPALNTYFALKINDLEYINIKHNHNNF